MPAPEFNADLLQPSLAEHDDAVGFDHPWNPQTIVLWTFFCGIVCGGILYGLNWRRLGFARRCWPTIIGSIASAFALALLVVWGIEQGWFAGGDQSPSRYIQRGVGIVLALMVAATQKRRYELAVVSNVPTGSLWKPGFASAAVGFAIQIGLGLIALLLIPEGLAHLRAHD